MSRPSLRIALVVASCFVASSSVLAQEIAPGHTAAADSVGSLPPGAAARSRAATSDSMERAANRRYRVGLGGSFDFLNGLSAADIYGDVTIRIPELVRAGSGRGVGIGFDAGLYNGRTTSFREVQEETRTFRFPGTPHRDSTMVVSQRIERTEDSYHDNLTLFIAPTLQLSRNVALAIHSGVRRSERVRTVLTRTMSQDTLVEGSAETGAGRPAGLPGDGSRTTRTQSYRAFFGIGPLINFDNADYNFWHKQIIGFEMVDGRLDGAFGVQFSLTDYDHGFKLGGEVRGKLNFEQPSIAIFLARDFSLGRLADFIVGGDGDDDGEPGDTGTSNEAPAAASPPPASPDPGGG